MKVHPDIAALRGNRASQRSSHEAVETMLNQWRNTQFALLNDLLAFGQGRPFDDCVALRQVMAQSGSAGDMLGPLIRGLVTTLAGHPLAQLPFRHQASESFLLLQLAIAERASLALALYLPDRGIAKSTAFVDGERRELVIAGRAMVQSVLRDPECEDRCVLDGIPREIGPDTTLHSSGPGVSRSIHAVDPFLLTLRLARGADDPGPTRYFDAASGSLVHCASADPRESSHEMMLAVLGRMGRKDAAPTMAVVARQGSVSLRWQALRHCLALDAATGFTALCAIAGDSADPLNRHASRVRRQLLEHHPQLATVEGAPCRV